MEVNCGQSGSQGVVPREYCSKWQKDLFFFSLRPRRTWRNRGPGQYNYPLSKTTLSIICYPKDTLVDTLLKCAPTDLLPVISKVRPGEICILNFMNMQMRTALCKTTLQFVLYCFLQDHCRQAEQTRAGNEKRSS